MNFFDLFLMDFKRGLASQFLGCIMLFFFSLESLNSVGGGHKAMYTNNNKHKIAEKLTRWLELYLPEGEELKNMIQKNTFNEEFTEPVLLLFYYRAMTFA